MIRFVRRAVPLDPLGVAVRGDAAVALGRRFEQRGAAGVVAVAAGDWIVAFADATDQLPWIDGAIWLGREPEASVLLCPTQLALEPHPALVARALARAGSEPPFALWPDGERLVLVSLAAARRPGGEPLAAFLARSTAA